ncbi:DNA-processing protein DprA [Mesonia sp. K7]|uniref:DNA-processing protein DprA n=1 Tax=Mesonia sp. K7 TaxID=2218606 RepID=UPI000DA863BE|nr:DNA-processing protein DprA [Mesonia sp. K7]PZD77414.1 DNA-protecting protein DprA [Mesonia sp. K7]
MTDNEILCLLALQSVPNIGDISAKKLLRHFGSAKAIFDTSAKEITQLEGFGTLKAKALHLENYLAAAEKEYDFIEKNNIQLHYFEDKTYPYFLKQCIDAPILLFSKGNISIENQPIISIVGTRNATKSGIENCENLIESLVPYNPIIVSGFAYGIDICAHKAAVKHNLQTIACLAHGFDTIYPKVHRKYEKDILAQGGFFTDFWSDCNFDRKNFLKRNRVIAGLSEATIVIESAEKGGSLVTANIANSYNREVFAFPGRIDDKYSKGCNHLIKTNQARLLENVEDLVYILNWDAKEQPAKQPELFVELTQEEEHIYSILKPLETASLDELALACQIPTYQMLPVLLNLELKGLVNPMQGKMFRVVK